MAKIIVFTNFNGGVSVCIPTSAISIEEVLYKDCPDTAIIVDDSILPQGDDDLFFDAWELNDKTILVNFDKAKAQYLLKYNSEALKVCQKRYLNTLAGIENEQSDEIFNANLTLSRTSIASAMTTTQLISIVLPQGNSA